MSEQPSRAAGGCAVAAMVLVVAGVVFATAPAAGILIVWSAGAVALWWSVSRPVHSATNLSPPPSGEVSVNEELQVTSLGNGAGYVVYPAGERVRVTRRRDES